MPLLLDWVQPFKKNEFFKPNFLLTQIPKNIIFLFPLNPKNSIFNNLCIHHYEKLTSKWDKTESPPLP